MSLAFMLKALITDLSRVLLFPKEAEFTGSLNGLHEKLFKEEGDYDFWKYFEINQELLAFYAELNKDLPVYVFTSKYIQEYPPLKERIQKRGDCGTIQQ